jgi:hypothetical protein
MPTPLTSLISVLTFIPDKQRPKKKKRKRREKNNSTQTSLNRAKKKPKSKVLSIWSSKRKVNSQPKTPLRSRGLRSRKRVNSKSSI